MSEPGNTQIGAQSHLAQTAFDWMANILNRDVLYKTVQGSNAIELILKESLRYPLHTVQ